MKTSEEKEFGEEYDKNAMEENVKYEKDRDLLKKRKRKIKKKSKQDGNAKNEWTKSDINDSPQAQQTEALFDHVKEHIIWFVLSIFRWWTDRGDCSADKPLRQPTQEIELTHNNGRDQSFHKHFTAFWFL